MKELGLELGVILEKKDESILIRPYTAQTRDAIYAKTLKMGTPSALNLPEVSSDHLML